MPADLSTLRDPFDRSRIKQREGAGRRMLDYVPSGDVIDRIVEATGNTYDWTVVRLEFVSDGKSAFWLCHGTLTIPGLGTRSGIGSAAPMNEDSVKSAETDAYKRAAVKFGVALDLYFKDGPPNHAPAVPPRNYAQEFKERAARAGYEGKMSPLCGALVGKDSVQASDYAEALKKSAAEWSRAIDSVAETPTAGAAP